MIRKWITRPYKKYSFISYVEHKYILYGFTYTISKYGDLEFDNKVHVVLKELFKLGDFKPSFKVNFYDVLKNQNISEVELKRELSC